LIATALFAVATLAPAQMNMSDDKAKRPVHRPALNANFPTARAFKIDYSSPRAKGRKIFGEASDKALVPYGQIWRTGANDATTFVTDANGHRGRKAVPLAAILSSPFQADAWSLVISKKRVSGNGLSRREGRFGTRSDERSRRQRR